MDIDKIVASGILPDPVLRFAVRRLLAKKIKNQEIKDIEKRQQELLEFIDRLKKMPIAVETDAANEQHYELPPQFFEEILGKNLKYSCCLFEDNWIRAELPQNLDEAEKKMLDLSCERAELKDGQKILELGCGWGSLTIYMAEKYPNAEIKAISNSQNQIEYIEGRLEERGLDNVSLEAADINYFKTEEKFDRVVSIEMFEHMRNYEKLISKIEAFLKEKGKLFVHIFTHHTYPFLYENEDSTNWMARYFFSGGTMPSTELLHYFSGNLRLENQWAVSGCHYKRTLEAWLIKMDEKKDEIWPIFKDTYGDQAEKWWNYWRLFFISSAEFFGYNDGNEWFISHYLFSK